MAQLSSPGASVTVIDESFYTPAAPGTTPLIIVASQENKANSAGTGIAPGTLKANAGKVYLLTSQMDLGSTFGIPYFQTDANNNPVHAGEVNEYGLQAAYSFLGVSNRAYVVRADLDTTQLEATGIEPHGLPTDGDIWFDTDATSYGIFEWNSATADKTGGQTFTVKKPTVITDETQLESGPDSAPRSTFGATGDYALVVTSDVYVLYYKKSSSVWVDVGSANWVKSRATIVGTKSLSGSDPIDDTSVVVINGYSVTGASSVGAFITAIGSHITGVSASLNAVTGNIELFSDGTGLNDGAIAISGDASVLLQLGIAADVYAQPALVIAPHTQPPQFKINGENRPTGSVWIKTTTPNKGAAYSVKTYNGSTGAWVEKIAPLYASAEAALVGLDTAGGLNIGKGTSYVKYNVAGDALPKATFDIYTRTATGAMTISSMASFVKVASGDNGKTFTISASTLNGTMTGAQTVTLATDDTALLIAGKISALNITNVVADAINGVLVIKHTTGGDINLVGFGANVLFSTTETKNYYANANGVTNSFVGSNWAAQTVTASTGAPTNPPADGQLWYNSVIDEVDIMIHNGHAWVGYQFEGDGDTTFDSPALEFGTDPMGPIVSATQPKTQFNGDPLAEGDLWVSTADLEAYPHIYRYSAVSKKWTLLDNSDQTTEDGVLFHDARWSTSGDKTTPASIQQLLVSDYVDFDAPDPALYPKGMLLWNLRRSGNNVLKYVENYVNLNDNNLRYKHQPMGGASSSGEPDYIAPYATSRWISEAPNATNGAGQFGRHAQRAVVLKALNALINENQQIRDEDSRTFNIIACPGYLETLPGLNALNADRGLLSFIVADAPARLAPDATTLSNWGNNTAGATGDGEVGLVSTDPYSAVYYPWGFTTDLIGNNIAVPPSHIMLRTIALSDNVSYEWFAPAGTRRGGVTNASSVGYVTAEGEFQTVALNNGQRDVLASINVNPITYLGGIGLVAYGQKTRQLVASALDRINVARLVIHLRYQLNAIAKPYIFEPNDTITRNEIKQQVESLMLELTGQRALYDYLVVCDTSNNTPSRIDRNELHVDIAIEPVKAVEFIYIPLRLENTGAIKGLGA